MNWFKQGFQLVADVAGCIPIPILADAVEILAEGGAFISGALDPTTTWKAELAEAGTRLAIAAIPIPGSSLAKIPATIAIKASRFAVREVGSAGLGMYIDYKEGKFGEMKVDEFDQMLHEMLSDQGIDYNALPKEAKDHLRASMYEKLKPQGVTLIDDNYKRLEVADVAPTGWQPGSAAIPEMTVGQPTAPTQEESNILTVSEIRVEAEARYREVNGIDADTKLSRQQMEDVEQVNNSITVYLLQKGIQVIDEDVAAVSRDAGKGLKGVNLGGDGDKIKRPIRSEELDVLTPKGHQLN